MRTDYTPISAEKQYQDKAVRALEKMKEYENAQTLHMQKIGSKTIVFCKNSDRIPMYEKLLKNT